jgi:hypothetical protein
MDCFCLWGLLHKRTYLSVYFSCFCTEGVDDCRTRDGNLVCHRPNSGVPKAIFPSPYTNSIFCPSHNKSILITYTSFLSYISPVLHLFFLLNFHFPSFIPVRPHSYLFVHIFRSIPILLPPPPPLPRSHWLILLSGGGGIFSLCGQFLVLLPTL